MGTITQTYLIGLVLFVSDICSADSLSAVLVLTGESMWDCQIHKFTYIDLVAVE